MRAPCLAHPPAAVSASGARALNDDAPVDVTGVAPSNRSVRRAQRAERRREARRARRVRRAHRQALFRIRLPRRGPTGRRGHGRR